MLSRTPVKRPNTRPVPAGRNRGPLANPWLLRRIVDAICVPRSYGSKVVGYNSTDYTASYSRR
jgi:hypothetical protein